MNIRLITSFSYVILAIAAIVTLFFVRSLKPTSVGAAAFFGLWLLIPYAVLAVILRARTNLAIEVANFVVTLFIVFGGLLFLVIVIFVHPDPQGGIAVFFTPIYQGIGMAVLVPLSRWMFNKWHT